MTVSLPGPACSINFWNDGPTSTSLNISSKVRQHVRGIRSNNSPLSRSWEAKAPYPPAGEGPMENLGDTYDLSLLD
eukprot:scaffold314951_cov83-Cyclotella_meneghiniana.AAC.2